VNGTSLANFLYSPTPKRGNFPKCLHCAVQIFCVIRVLIIRSSRIAFYWELRGDFVHLCDIMTVLGVFRLQIDFISASQFTRALSCGFLAAEANASRLYGKLNVGGVEEFSHVVSLSRVTNQEVCNFSGSEGNWYLSNGG